MARRALLALPPLALLAIACAASGLDRRLAQRQAAGDPTGPLWIGPHSDRERAWRAIGRHDLAAARRDAAAAVARAPLDPAGLSLFATIAGANGEAMLSRRAMTVAAALGWRDPATRAFWLREGERSGDAPRVARNADALLRTGSGRQTGSDALGALERDDHGRAAVADRLAERPPWLAAYIDDLRAAAPDPAARRVATLSLAARRGMRADCVAIGGAAQGLLQAGVTAPAARLWHLCDPAASPATGIADGGFDRVATGGGPSPFRWLLLPSGAVDVAVADGTPPMRGPALRFRSDSSADEPIARQTLLLPPGDYRVTWLEHAEGGGAPASRPQVRCLPGASRLEIVPGDGDERHRFASFVVPADGCAAQIVFLTVAAKSAGLIDTVTVTRSP